MNGVSSLLFNALTTSDTDANESMNVRPMFRAPSLLSAALTRSNIDSKPTSDVGTKFRVPTQLSNDLATSDTDSNEAFDVRSMFGGFSSLLSAALAASDTDSNESLDARKMFGTPSLLSTAPTTSDIESNKPIDVRAMFRVPSQLSAALTTPETDTNDEVIDVWEEFDFSSLLSAALTKSNTDSNEAIDVRKMFGIPPLLYNALTTPNNDSPISSPLSVSPDASTENSSVASLEHLLLNATSPDETTRILCVVCGDCKSRLQYGVQACSGCATFFKRFLKDRPNYDCITGMNNCEIFKTHRRYCQACRIQKCFRMGMRTLSVRPRNTSKEKHGSPIKQSSSTDPGCFAEPISALMNRSGGRKHPMLDPKNHAPKPETIFSLESVTLPCIQKIIKWAQFYQPFTLLPQDEKKQLLISHWCSLLCLEICMHPDNCENEELRQLQERFRQFKVTEPEFAALKAVTLFTTSWQARQYGPQLDFSILLLNHCSAHRSDQSTWIARITMFITELRNPYSCWILNLLKEKTFLIIFMIFAATDVQIGELWEECSKQVIGILGSE